jgi:hypothetical protein
MGRENDPVSWTPRPKSPSISGINVSSPTSRTVIVLTMTANYSHTTQPTMNATNPATSGLNHGVQLPNAPPLTNAIRPSSDLGRGDTYPFRHIDPARYKCDKCRRKGQNRSYCNSCGIVYCLSCWDQQFVHSGVAGATVHERTDIRIYEILRASLRPDRTESEQKELHRRDESTTWFGVAREGGIEESTFKDYGRFWNMMKESSRRGVRNVYPGLVSFVGHTGGKRVSFDYRNYTLIPL